MESSEKPLAKVDAYELADKIIFSVDYRGVTNISPTGEKYYREYTCEFELDKETKKLTAISSSTKTNFNNYTFSFISDEEYGICPYHDTECPENNILSQIRIDIDPGIFSRSTLLSFVLDKDYRFIECPCPMMFDLEYNHIKSSI